MVDGPKLVIDYLLSYQLFQLPEFWAGVPSDVVDAALRAEVDAALGKALQAAMGSSCSGCTALHIVMRVVHTKVWKAIASAGPTVTDAVVAVVVSKRGYRPKPIVVYYKGDSGKAERLLL